PPIVSPPPPPTRPEDATPPPTASPIGAVSVRPSAAPMPAARSRMASSSPNPWSASSPVPVFPAPVPAPDRAPAAIPASALPEASNDPLKPPVPRSSAEGADAEVGSAHRSTSAATTHERADYGGRGRLAEDVPSARGGAGGGCDQARLV